MLIWIRHQPPQLDAPSSAALAAGDMGAITLSLLSAIGWHRLVSAGTILHATHAMGLPVSVTAIHASTDPVHTEPGNIPCLNIVQTGEQSIQIQLVELEKLQPCYFIPKLADPISRITAERRSAGHPWKLTLTPGYPWGLKSFLSEAVGKGFVINQNTL